MVLRVVIVTLCAVLLAGCGGDDDGELNLGGGSGDTAAPTSPGALEEEKEEHPGGPVELTGELPAEGEPRAAVQAWVEFYTAYADAAALADPDHGPWRDTMTDEAYKGLRPAIEALAENDRTQRGMITLSPSVALSQDGRVQGLSDCVDLGDVRTYDKSGDVVGEVDPPIIWFDVRFQRDENRWLIAEVSPGPEDRC